MAHRLRYPTPSPPAGSWNPERQLSEALAERDRFLKRYPQHQQFQNEIDRLLEKAGPAENRMAVLAMLMEHKLVELHGQLQNLNRILLSAQEV